MKKAYILAAISIFFWSTVATVTKLLMGSLSSMQVLCISALFAGSFWLIFNIATGNIKKLKAYGPKDWLKTVLIGLPGTFVYYLLFYTGTDLMPASQAFIINYLWPIMSVIFACVILKEKLTVRKCIAIGLSFLGVVIVAGKDLLNLNGGVLLGASCCAVAAASYGLFTALNTRSGYDKRLSMMVFYFVTFVLTFGILAVQGNLQKPELIQLAGMAYNGIFTMAIASTGWAIALESGKTAKISNLAYITPFLSLVWTAVFLKEEISLASIAGLVVIVLGILIQLKDKQQ